MLSRMIVPDNAVSANESAVDAAAPAPSPSGPEASDPVAETSGGQVPDASNGSQWQCTVVVGSRPCQTPVPGDPVLGLFVLAEALAGARAVLARAVLALAVLALALITSTRSTSARINY